MALLTFLPSPPLLPVSPVPDAALFLDFDGTLVEIAPTPDSVRVAPDLPGQLQELSQGLGGALAVVSGRPLRDLDHFLPVSIAKVGDHGASVRLRSGDEAEVPALPHPPPAWREAAADLVARHPGALIEDKEHGFVVHYRLAPEAGPPAKALLDALLPEEPAFTLLQALMAWEVRPGGVSKATAVRRLMAQPPFAGRTPVFIGDDVTDEEGMAAAVELGGQGFKLQDAFGTPAALRAWIAAALRSGASLA